MAVALHCRRFSLLITVWQGWLDTRNVVEVYSNKTRAGNWLSKGISGLCRLHCTYYIDKYFFEESYGCKGLEGRTSQYCYNIGGSQVNCFAFFRLTTSCLHRDTGTPLVAELVCQVVVLDCCCRAVNPGCATSFYEGRSEINASYLFPWKLH